MVATIGLMGRATMPSGGSDRLARTRPIGSEELAESMAPLMMFCIEQFGPNRCMFESNFPVDKVSYSYNVMYNAFKRLSKGYSAAERATMSRSPGSSPRSISGNLSCPQPQSENSSVEHRPAHRHAVTRKCSGTLVAYVVYSLHADDEPV